MHEKSDVVRELGTTGRLSRLRRNPVVENAAIVVALVATWAYGWASNVGNLIVRGEGTIVQGVEQIPDSGLADLASRGILVIFALAIATGIWASSAHKRERDTRGLFVALAPAVVLVVVSNPVHDVLPTQVQVFSYAAVMFALWLRGPSRLLIVSTVTSVIAGCVASLALGVGGVGALTPNQGVAVDKALVFDSLLAGLYNYNNPLGLIIVASFPLLLLIRSKPLAVMSGVIMVAALVWTGSRTSLLALAGTLAMALALYCLRRHTVLRRWFAVAALAAISIAVVLVPIVFRHQPESLSSRGEMWDRIFTIWAREPWFGLGRGAFEAGGELAEGLQHVYAHGHNFFMTVLLTTGVVGALTVVVLMATICAVAIRSLPVSPVPLLLVTSMLIVSVMETPGNFFPFERIATTSSVVWLVFALSFWSRDRRAFAQAFRVLPPRSPRVEEHAK